MEPQECSGIRWLARLWSPMTGNSAETLTQQSRTLYCIYTLNRASIYDHLHLQKPLNNHSTPHAPQGLRRDCSSEVRLVVSALGASDTGVSAGSSGRLSSDTLAEAE